MATCGRCRGSGKCQVCDGRGKTGGFFTATCSACTPKGSGKCDRCKGTGHAH